MRKVSPTASKAPSRNATPREITNDRESANKTRQTQYSNVVTSTKRPLCLGLPMKITTPEPTSAPTAGAPNSTPKPCAPTARRSLAKIGIIDLQSHAHAEGRGQMVGFDQTRYQR